MSDDNRKHVSEEGALELAHLFCKKSSREVARLFRNLWSNDDALRYRSGVSVVEGRYAWLEEGIMDVPSPEGRRLMTDGLARKSPVKV